MEVKLRRACSGSGKEEAFHFAKRGSPHIAPYRCRHRQLSRRGAIRDLHYGAPRSFRSRPDREFGKQLFHAAFRWSAGFKLSDTCSKVIVQEVKESGFKISCCYPKLEAFFIRRIDSGIKRSSSTSLRTPESGSHPGPWFGCGEHFEPLPVIQPARSLFTHLS